MEQAKVVAPRVSHLRWREGPLHPNSPCAHEGQARGGQSNVAEGYHVVVVVEKSIARLCRCVPRPDQKLGHIASIKCHWLRQSKQWCHRNIENPDGAERIRSDKRINLRQGRRNDIGVAWHSDRITELHCHHENALAAGYFK